MRSPEPVASPVTMQRVAFVAPVPAMRDVLAQIAGSGVAELDPVNGDPDLPAARFLPADQISVTPAISATGSDPARWAGAGRFDLVAGEVALQRHVARAVRRGEVCAVGGWVPRHEVADLAARIGGLGGAVVPMRPPRGVDVPTMLTGGPTRRGLAMLVEAYGTVPYRDVDPTLIAAFAYVVMFGMMFGDAGQGLILLALGAMLRAGWPPWPRWLRRVRKAWPFIAGAGVTSIIFGLLYGEFCGPTGVVPKLWLNPVDKPISLLAAAIGVGAVLLAGAFALGTVNRIREGGWRLAAYASSGLAGSALFAGAALAGGGWYLHRDAVIAAGGVLGACGLAAAFLGLLAQAGRGAAGVVQAIVESVDVVIRLGTNVVSFARLAAFGLTHAAILALVWDATAGLSRRGPAWLVAAVLVFAVGNAAAFALEALIAGIQALRLSYYELFSRVFQDQGRPFVPWHLPITKEESP